MKATQLLHDRGQSLWLDNITHLQSEGAESFVKSWNDLMQVISSKTATLDKGAALKAAS